MGLHMKAKPSRSTHSKPAKRKLKKKKAVTPTTIKMGGVLKKSN
jgi:hypothetical protein